MYCIIIVIRDQGVFPKEQENRKNRGQTTVYPRQVKMLIFVFPWFQIDIVSLMSYHVCMDIFRWSAEKNETLARERGITFEEVVQRIADGAKIVETDHPNQVKYPNQKILIVDVAGYAYLVPCVKEGNEYFLKTVIPSRKATKKYLGTKHDK